MASQSDRDRVYRFIEAVRAIRAGREQGLALSEYWPREIADGIQAVIDNEVRKEREACAMVAESAAEGGDAIRRGDEFDIHPEHRRICFEIAETIRRRR